jgi:hypothetical protein
VGGELVHSTEPLCVPLELGARDDHQGQLRGPRGDHQ